MTASTDPPSGRALDREIHLRIFGHSTQSACSLCPKGFYLDPSNRCPHVPPYSSDIRAAWLIVERMREQGYRVQVTNNRDDVPWVAVFSHETRYATDFGSAVGDTVPLAICRAALSAIEGRRVNG